jgi:hypothetical protein
MQNWKEQEDHWVFLLGEILGYLVMLASIVFGVLAYCKLS